MSNKIGLPNELFDAAIATQAINSLSEGVTITDMSLPDQPLIFVNQAFENMTGYKITEVIGKNCRFLQGNLRDQPELAIIRKAIQNRSYCQIVLKNFKKDGTLFWNELSLSPIKTINGISDYYVGIQKDLTKEILQNKRISYLSEHDDLTGLINYRSFINKLLNLISDSQNKNLILGIGIADIDFFKKINDEYGHLQGNTVLRIIGQALKKQFADSAIVARLGGDEFSFGMTLLDENCDIFYNKITRVVAAANLELPNSCQVTMSAGMVINKPNTETNIEHLINLADKIMYKNKQMRHRKRELLKY